MATLFNTKISATYKGLLKTIDNAAISATLRELTDGSGNQSGLYLNTAGDFKVTNVLEWGSLKDTGTGVTITQFVTSTDGIENFNNNTTLPTSAAVKLYVDTKFSQTDTLQEVLTFGNTTSGTDIAVSAGDDITFTDSSKILMGASADLQIYHDGSNSYIAESGTGLLNIFSNGGGINLLKNTGEFMAEFATDGAVSLFYDNSKKFETTSTGVAVTGDLVVTGTITGSGGSFLPLAGGTMTGNIVLNDNVKSIYGTANDGLEIYHDGTDSYINDTGTGGLIIRAANNIKLQTNTAELYLQGIKDGAVKLYYDNSEKLLTSSTGVNITGALSTTTNVSVGANATFVDNGKALFGTSNDLQIYHDGSNSYVRDVGTGNLNILASTSINLLNGDSSDYMARFNDNGSNQFFYDGSKKLETLTDGAKVTGNLEVTGTITGAGGSFLPLIGGTMTGNTIHNDNVKSIYGTASDGLQIYHDGANSYIADTGTGDLIIKGAAGVELKGNASNTTLAYFVDGGASSLYYNNNKKFATTNTGISVTGDGVFTGSVSVPDAKFLSSGSSNDLTLIHTGVESIISNYTGQLNIQQLAVTESIVFRVSNANAGDTTALIISRNGDLTTGRDVTIAGDLTVNGTTTTVNSQTLSVDDPLISLAINNDANSLDIGYYGKYNDGTTRYLGLYNDASDSNKFKLFKGTTVEPTTTVDIGAAGYVAADLELANLVATGNINLADNGKAIFGTGNDLQIYHNVNHSYIDDVGTGKLILRGNSAIELHKYTGEYMLTAVADGAVSLYYDDSKKFATTIAGVSVTGDLTVTQAINGRYFRTEATNTDYNLITRDNAGNALFVQNTQSNTNQLIASFQYGSATVNEGTTVLQVSKDVSYFDNCKVGIGTDSPSVGLQLGNSTSGETKTAIFNSEGGGEIGLTIQSRTNRAKLRVADNDSNAYVVAEAGKAFFGTSANGDATNITVLTSGNVGIGTDSPSAKLHVEGNVLINAYNQGVDNGLFFREGFLTIDQPSITVWDMSNAGASPDGLSINANDGIRFRENGGEVARFKDGNFGIGATSPDAKLEVAGDVLISSGEYLSWGTIGATSIEGSTASNRLQFRTSSTDRMVINDTGVGVGTSSPDTTLHVDGGNANNVATFESTDDTARIILKDDDTAGYFIAKDNVISIGGSTTIANNLNVDVTSGKVGIGTSNPQDALDIDWDTEGVATDNSGIRVRAYRPHLNLIDRSGYTTSNGHNFQIKVDDAKLQFNTTSADDETFDLTRMVIDSLGNVGIGTDSPNAKLQVNNGVSGNVASFQSEATAINEYTGITLHTQVVSNDDWYGSEIRSINTGGTPSVLNPRLGFFTQDLGTYLPVDRTEKLSILGNGNVGIGTDSPNAFGFLEKVLNVSAGNSSSTTLQQSGLILSGSSDANDANDFSYLSFTNYQSTLSNGRVAEIRASKDGGVDTGQVGFYTSSGSGPAQRMRITGSGAFYLYDIIGFSGTNSDMRYDSASGQVYYLTSSARYKSDITNLENSLNKVNDLRPVRFKDNHTETYTTGLIAEEVVKVIPEVVFNKEVEGFDSPQVEGVNYSDLVPFLIKSIQELTAKVERLEAK